MPAKILKNPVEVDNRLEQLGFTRDQLIEIAEAMVSARADCTPNDPPGAPGWSSWRMGTRRAREVLLVGEDWERDDSDQISSVLNKRLRIRLAVANTDDATGIEQEHPIPQNWSRKGAATDKAVMVNQRSFMDILDASLKVVPLRQPPKPSGPIITWYLCVYSEGDEFRVELSCPSGLESGFFTDFIERILIVGPDDGGSGGLRRRGDGEGDDGPEFNIPVVRKK
jgi:hypothetical protein